MCCWARQCLAAVCPGERYVDRRELEVTITDSISLRQNMKKKGVHCVGVFSLWRALMAVLPKLAVRLLPPVCLPGAFRDCSVDPY